MALVMAMRARMAAARRLVRAGVCDGCLDKSPRKEISFAHSLPDAAAGPVGAAVAMRGLRIVAPRSKPPSAESLANFGADTARPKASGACASREILCGAPSHPRAVGHVGRVG